MKERWLQRRHKEPAGRHRFALLAGNTMMFAGAIILIAALLYILFNIQRIDEIYVIWLVWMMAGLFLVFMSHMIKWLMR